MAPPPELVFFAAFALGIILFGLLTIGVPIVLRLAEFRFRGRHLLKVFGWRYLAVAFLAGVAATYLYVREPVQTNELAWMSVIVSVIGWSVVLVVWDLLVVEPEGV